ncbi:amino acid adenylation domain-containing protein [Albibacterium profundi]|uniref:Amino acid adenylation domain-containing protein n=1 Tax=Albibacterium profundi TaxID=3134906 RepID=A0ABV5CE62_9SPHI
MGNSTFQYKTIVDLFREQVDRAPDNIAVEFNDESLTYRQLDEKSNQLAHYLQSAGVGEETLVPLCLNRSMDMIIGALGILKAGGAYVPIDPEYPIDRILYTIQDTQARVIITETGTLLSATEIENTQTILLDREDASIGKQAISSPEVTVKPENLCYIIYTSGSTGRPKGVMIEHRNVVRLFFNDSPLFDFNENDIWTMFHSFCFDFSVWEMYGALFFGGKVIVIPKSTAQDSAAYAELLEIKNVTVLNQTPSAFYLLQEHILDRKPNLNIRFIIFGGEALNPSKLKQWKETYPKCKLINMYGITETTVHVTYQEISQEHYESSKSVIGKPIPTLYTYILDENQKQVPYGVEGELYVGGAGLARGYLNMPDLTSERFILDHLGSEPSARLYRTGDLAKMHENKELEYLGRIDDQVKIRGFRIELAEIESVLLEIPTINQAIVLANEDQAGNKRLVAYLVTEEQLENDTITNHLATKLPSYMIPQLFVPIESIPLTSNGKIDKKNLPNPDASDLIKTLYAAPTNELEAKLTKLIKNILQVNRVGIDDNFFELGGNSLLAQKVISNLSEINVKLPITKLYQYPTVRKLAGELQKDEKTTHTKRKPRPAQKSDVAVIGMAGRFPGASTINELWQNLRYGKESITFFSKEELDHSLPQSLIEDADYVAARGVISDAKVFDANFFEINTKIAEVLDPQHRKFLEISWEALEQAGYASCAGESIGVYAGSSSNTYFNNNIYPNKDLMARVGDFQVLTLSDKDFLATRVAYCFDLKGPALTVQSACSTSLLAIAEAVKSIRSGQCDVALAGGVAINSPINSGHLYEEGSILSSDGHCRTFDAEAKGTVFSDGAAVILLKDLKQAEEDGDFIYGVIKGIGINNDGGGKGSFTAPSSEGQATSILNALEDAQVDPASISYVEAHGTATPIGDPIEIEGLNIAFGEQEKKQYCALGSIKSNMGHLTQAAGAAGFIKTVLSLHHQELPPSINFSKTNPHLNLEESPFYVNDQLSKWESDGIRRAGVSSFGVGGTNVHVILEEYQQTEKESSAGRPYELLTWSAKSKESVDAYAEKLKDHIQENSDLNLADVAYSLQTSKATFNHRRFAIASNNQDLIEKLNPLFQSADTKNLKEKPGNLIFVFPGQGAQYINMGKELYTNEAIFKEAVDECAELLKSELGEDIRDIIFTDSENKHKIDTLNNTYYTQPALFVTEYALAKLWMSLGAEPNWYIGHSIGEFVAAHLAGVFSLKDALHLIANRGKLMSSLAAGSMLAVRTNHKNIEGFLPTELSLAAINSQHLCVVAGPSEAVQKFIHTLEENEIVSKLLHTSHAFHSSMMDEIVEPFAELTRSLTLNVPQKPIISTVTGTWLKDSDATDPIYWAKHLRSTVRFSDAVQTALEEEPNSLFMEIGPRNGSTTLIRQHIQKQNATAIAALEHQSNQNEYVSFLRGIGHAWLNGLEIDWQAYYYNQKRKTVSTPTYAFEKKECWVEPVTILSAAPATPSEQPKTQQPVTNQISTPHYNTEMRKTQLIEKIKSILENASGIETAGMNSESSFFEIGLDSLLLTQVALTLKKEFKLPITFRKLTEEYDSLSALADYLDANLPDDTQPNIPAVPVNVLVPSSSTPNLQATDLTASDNAIGLISQQINLLAQQISLLQNGSTSNHNGHSLKVASNQSSDSDITPEEAVELKKPFGATAKIDKQRADLSASQHQFLEKFITRYNQKTTKSKAYTQQHRRQMADPRVVSGFRPLTKEMTYQLVVEKSKGSYLWDIDGNQYIDLLNGFGSNLLGYQPDFLKKALIDQIEKGYEIGPQHVLAGEVSQLICEFTGHDRVGLCNTGSEAVLGAMRIARTVTGKSLIVAFTGSYHGIVDEVLVRGTKKLKSFPAASGIMPEAVQNMLILDYGTEESLQIIKDRADEIAAVLVEPVQSRRPEFQPIEFLKELRKTTTQKEVVLIFDEIITGFRMHPGGAQALFGIKADIATYGKVVGGGVSIGIIAGKKDYMDALDGGYWEYGDDSAPEVGVTYFAGTFVRHPLALATAKASLLYMKERGPKLQDELNQKTKTFTDRLQRICTKYNLPHYIVRFGSLWKIKYKEEYPYSELLFALMREKGVHILDSFPCFITESHTTEELSKVSAVFEECILELLENNLIPVEKLLEEKVLENTIHFADEPPIEGALLGKDADGNPAWFLPDDNIPGKYLQINL